MATETAVVIVAGERKIEPMRSRQRSKRRGACESSEKKDDRRER